MKKIYNIHDSLGRLWIKCGNCSRLVLAGHSKIGVDRLNRLCRYCKRGNGAPLGHRNYNGGGRASEGNRSKEF